MSYLNSNFWKKSYLLEFKIDGILTDAFTFSVPPEQESFSFPQRKGETKTFGGMVVADYGNDAVQISLSGSTINETLKLIYKSSLGSTELTGSEEIFYLRDLLKKYGSQDKLQRKEVYLYSLNGGEVGVKNNPKWWQIFVSTLEISRSKEKPFTYNYKFEAIGLPEVLKKNKFHYNKKDVGFSLKGLTDDNFLSGVQTWTNKLKDYNQTAIDYGASFIGELYNAIEMSNSLIDIFETTVSSYANVIKFGTDDIAGFNKDVIGVADRAISSALRFQPSLAADVWNSCVNMVDSFVKIADFALNLPNTYGEAYWQQVKELFSTSSKIIESEDSTQISEEEISDSLITNYNAALNVANAIKVAIKKNLNEQGISVIPGNVENDDQIIITYGYKTIEISDAETSWDQIALKYYGDPSLSCIIAVYNNLPANQPLKAGKKILIPQLDMASNTSADNEVYNVPDVKDNYGSDLKINTITKDFEINNGDIVCIKGADNLQQALLNRYSSEIGSRVRLELYGIQTSIGNDARASSALIQASINQTTVEDPRVESVDNITFLGKGDNLKIQVVYTDINNATKTFGGIYKW